MNTDKLFHNQDETMEHIMLFAPMPVLQAIQDSFTESMLADMYAEDAEIFGESVPVHSGRKLSAKQRRAARRVQNARHKVSDRKHGKHARDVRKAIWEDTADWDDMPNNTYFRWDEKRKTFMSPKKPKVHRVKRTFRDRQNAAFRDRLTDITPIERLTSVLAEVKQYHGMVGCTWNVFYLTEAICQREQLPYPDYAYVQEYGKTVKLVLEYFDSYEDEDYSTHEYIDLRA